MTNSSIRRMKQKNSYNTLIYTYLKKNYSFHYCLISPNFDRTYSNSAMNIIIHQGKNIRIFRELRGYKQEALAAMLGERWTQKRVSLLESKETIPCEIVTNIAEILDIPPSLIHSFRPEELFKRLIEDFQTPTPAPAQTILANLYRVHLEKIELYQRIAQEKDCIIEVLRKQLV